MLDILCDPATTGVVVVTTPEEMPVTETLDLVGRLEHETGVAPSTIVANRVQHGLFDDGQREAFERLGTVDSVGPILVEAAGRAVRTVMEAARITERRAEVGAGHLERLRNGLPAGLGTIVVPELYTRASGRRVVTLVAEALAGQITDERRRGG